MKKEDKKQVKISEVKGRPMLHWIGKRSLDVVKAFPAQLTETFNTDNAPVIPSYESLNKNWVNLLFHGDNKEVLSTLLVNGFRSKIDLIYIDPPFASGADYVRQIELRGTKTAVEGEQQSLIEQVQYADIWANDNYLQFMYERLVLLRELLSDKGSIYLHCDWHKDYHLRFLMDEIFGEGNFINEIIWHYASGGVGYDNFARKHDNLLLYSKTNIKTLNLEDVKIERTEKSLARAQNPKGARITQDNTLKLPDDVWDIQILNPQEKERLAYPTQKPEALIEKVIKASSNPGSIILDCFCGSGTTQAVAQKLGRRWIGADINNGAIQTTSKRLQSIIKEQQKELKIKSIPSLGFAVYKINDYDLQIQHNELKELVFHYLGITKSKTDRYFDGTLGKELVKIIPFNHPLTLLDLQLVKDELAKRKDEERDIVLVSLGRELKVDDELKSYNKLKPVNKIRSVELRTDKKYGAFFVHKSAKAEVKITRKNKKAEVKITEFISPTIIQRLDIEPSMLKAQIKDFRSMIDCVLIDTDYNGKAFNICISDVPEKKQDFVKAEYSFDLPRAEAEIAVKIIDMLGEEVLITK